MARAPRLGINVIYDVTNKEALKPFVKEIAKDFSIADGGDITLNGANINNVTIYGGAFVRTDSLGNASIGIMSSSLKSDPHFFIESPNVTIQPGNSYTVTTNYVGNGIVSYYPNANFNVTQLNSNNFQIIPRVENTTSDLGFWLSETSSLYGAAQNCKFTVLDGTIVLMHFNDQSNLLLNSGYSGDFELSSGSYSYTSAGHFGGAIAGTFVISPTEPFKIGESDFTIQYWHKEQDQYAFTKFLTPTEDNICYFSLLPTPPHYITMGYTTPNGDFVTETSDVLEQQIFHHFATVYQKNLHKLDFYIDGVNKWTQTVDLPTRIFQNFYQNSSIVDELLITKKALWTADFTPPQQPFN